MKDSEMDDGLDLEMDRRLAGFARGTREPALPDAVAELPWTVQLDRPRTSRLDSWRGSAAGSAASIVRPSPSSGWE